MKTQGEMDNLRKLRATFCENIRTKWTGYIRRRTGFIRLRSGFIRCAGEASPLAEEASPIGPYIIFFHFSPLFSQLCLYCLQQEFNNQKHH